MIFDPTDPPELCRARFLDARNPLGRRVYSQYSVHSAVQNNELPKIRKIDVQEELKKLDARIEYLKTQINSYRLPQIPKLAKALTY